MENNTSVDHPLIKAVSAWLVAIGISSWSDFAAMCAAIYSILLIIEWIWRKFLRSFLENKGILKRKMRRAEDKENELN